MFCSRDANVIPMKTIIAGIFVILFSVHAFSFQAPASFQTIGKGMMKWTFFHLYEAEYLAPSKSFDLKQPFALKLTYQRHLKGHLIAERTGVEMEKVGFKNPQVEKWVGELKTIFPDVQEGTTLVGYYQPGVGTQFFNGEKMIGEIKGEDFANAFFSIWLSPKTSEPQLRKKLLSL